MGPSQDLQGRVKAALQRHQDSQWELDEKLYWTIYIFSYIYLMYVIFSLKSSKVQFSGSVCLPSLLYTEEEDIYLDVFLTHQLENDLKKIQLESTTSEKKIVDCNAAIINVAC